MRNLPDSTHGKYERFKWGMHANQERDDSLNYFNDTMFLTPVYLSFLQPNKSFYLSRDFCFDAILFTISTSYSQLNESNRWGSKRESCILKKKPCI